MKFERRTLRLAALCGAAGIVGAGAAPSRAVEALDGDLQLHGELEIQTRVLASDYDASDGFHLGQWWNILNLELEYDVAPEGWGPFDLISTYTRAEVRYDCVWTGGCYMLPNYRERYGNDATRLPRRLSDGHRSGLIGSIDPDEFSDKRNAIKVPLAERSAPYGAPAGLGQSAPNTRHVGRLWNDPVLGQLFFAGAGPDRIWGEDLAGFVDDSGFYVASDVLDYRFGFKKLPGAVGGNATQTLGPWRPEDKIPARGILRDRANALREGDVRPALGNPLAPTFIGPLPGQGALPFRPAPQNEFASAGVPYAPLEEAQGLHVPNAGFVRARRDDAFSTRPDQNFSQTELAFNHGAAQETFGELKEAYVDIEMFDHHLWLRTGKQTIVWGKTELFRSQDQFNPQDLGLSSLPTLEESRIALLSTRAVWSFYDVGPLEDVRLELAINWDRFYPADIGRCGEPFAPRPSCTKSYGMFADSLVGTGIAGEYRHSYPWNDVESLEGGARLEWRQDRVSFALTYFNGLDDFPSTDPIFVFERNVDPRTGRPRRAGSREPCDPDGLFGPPDSSGCLGGDPPALDNPDHVADVLANHHANQQLFHVLCASTVSLSTDLLPEGCGFNIWNSVEPAITDPTNPLFAVAPRLAMAFSTMVAGLGPDQVPFPGPFMAVNGKSILQTLGRVSELTGPLMFGDEDDMPLVPLVADPDDYSAAEDDAWFLTRYVARGLDPGNGALLGNYAAWRQVGMARFLTDEQEALFGCGRLFGSDCDVDGFDLFNAEASAVFQSWPGIPGTEGGVWLTNDATRVQPGTLGFAGGPVCSRVENGVRFMLPGCRGPSDPGYDVLVDGTPPTVDPSNPMVLPRNGVPGAATAPDYLPGHPFTGQPWRSEVAAASWNLLMVFVAASIVIEADDSGELADGRVCGVDASCVANNGLNDLFETLGQEGRFDEFNPREPFATDRCSFVNPTLCRLVSALTALGGQGSRSLRAAGNRRFGRLDFLWHGGAEVALDYRRRHVMGLSSDFAHDASQSNWNVEFTWFHEQRFTDNASFSTTSDSDVLNLTLSVDRPTFVRFLNKNRTFFVNGQLFLRYITDWRKNYVENGPLNALFTIGVFTGYHQDRLVPGIQFVYDVGAESGAVLWSVAYRATQNFTIQLGLNTFFGTVQSLDAALVGLGTAGSGGRGEGQQHAYVENGLSTVRDRDEIFIRLRYSF